MVKSQKWETKNAWNAIDEYLWHPRIKFAEGTTTYICLK